MVVGTYLEQMLKRRHARQMAEAKERGFEQGYKQGFERGYKRGFERGVAKGRAELSAQIREWNERRLAAKAKGEPFDEPPPGLDG